LNKGKNLGLIEGLGNVEFNFIKLQFASDSLLFYVNNNVINLKLLIYLFKNMNGLRINFHKSVALRINGIAHQNLEVVCMFNCKEGSFPLTYQGLSLRAKSPS